MDTLNVSKRKFIECVHEKHILLLKNFNFIFL